jgi:integrase
MPTLKHRVPSYRRHRRSGQAVVTLDGHDFYLGPHGTKTSRGEYDRLVGEWQANGRRLPTNGPADVTVNELFDRYLTHAEGHYVKNGLPTSEVHCLRSAIRPLTRLYGHHLVSAFGPVALKTVRQAMIDAGLCRGSINHQIDRIRRAVRWGVENELVASSVHEALRAVAGLRAGRTEARESAPVKPVPEAHVDAILPYVSRQVAAMIHLQSLSGMRPGELVIVRGRDLETSGKIWAYRPESHKSEHHGHERVVYLGPRAQQLLTPWLRTDLAAYLFSPAEAEAERNAARRKARKTPMTPSQSARRPKRHRGRPPLERYTRESYRRAIDYALAAVNAKLTKDAAARGAEPQLVPHWHPHQLRHNAGTRIRKEFGLEAARVVLGHRSAAVTEVYAEIDQQKAATIMAQLG